VVKLVVAIDGYASCGKSTLAKRIAGQIQCTYIDSGAMYRAVTLHLIRKGLVKKGVFDASRVLAELGNIVIDFQYHPDTGASETFLNGENVEREIRLPAVSGEVSPVSTIPEVRERLVALQRKMGEKGSVVMDGRDIGTVVFPNAEIKFFMTASPDVRAKRRYDELTANGEKVLLQDVRTGLLDRDRIDENRDVAPLRKAADATVIDNSYLSEDEQFELAIQYLNKRLKQLDKSH